MFEKLKANILFEILLKRPDIEKAYAMVPPTDAWFDTITKVHQSLERIKKLPHEVLEITSHDGLTLRAVNYPGESSKTVICVHGFTSHAEREWAFPGLFYHSLGFNILIPYQRAHGLSEGKYISFGAWEHRDMLKWVETINERHPDGSILIHGLSMGGGITLDLSDKEIRNVRCLIADAPSVSIQGFFRDVVNSSFRRGQEKILAYVTERFQKEFSVNVSDFESMERVKNCRYPLLLSAGEHENRQEQLQAIKNINPQKTTVLILPGCNHGNGMYKQTEVYQSSIKTFLDENMT